MKYLLIGLALVSSLTLSGVWAGESGSQSEIGRGTWVAQASSSKTGSASAKTADNGAVFRGSGPKGGSTQAGAYLTKSGISTNVDVKVTIALWIRFLLPIAAIIAVVALVWAGVLYITSLGDDGRRETAKNIILYVIIGILLVLGAYAIVRLFMEADFNK